MFPAMKAQNLHTVPPGKSPRVFLTWIWGAQDIRWEDWYWATAVIQGRYYWMWNEDSVRGRGRSERTWRHLILMLESCKTCKGRKKISPVSLLESVLRDAWLVLETQDQNAWKVNTEESKKIVLADLSAHRSPGRAVLQTCVCVCVCVCVWVCVYTENSVDGSGFEIKI